MYMCLWKDQMPRLVTRVLPSLTRALHAGACGSASCSLLPDQRSFLCSTSCLHATRGLHSSVPWPNTQPHVNKKGDFPTGSNPISLETLNGLLESKKEKIFGELVNQKTNKNAVFANSELSLKMIEVYGFDFDYTLVNYSKEVHKLIYEMARDRLVEQLNYPAAIKGIAYNPTFAIRGLHCDIRNGVLMKIDAYNHIQLSSVYKGHTHLSPEEVVRCYGGIHVPMHVLDDLPTTSNWKLTQFLDLFSIPEATLFADISEYLISNGNAYDPEYLFEDVTNTVQEVHQSGQIHRIICSDLERYLEINPRLPEFLNRLKDAGKKMFIITNSPYWFVNQGMTHVLQSSDWRDLFDVVVVAARKPSFYSDSNRPFRCLNSQSMTPTWERVTGLEKGYVYQQGNVNDFIKMTDWGGSHVLYIGDHVFSDLAEPILQHGWKTGAIIPELEKEIECANSERFKKMLAELLAVENLLQMRLHYTMEEAVVERLKEKRSYARNFLKKTHNPRFGSVFRTEKSPTYFSRRLATFSNLYTSSLDNLMHYSLNYTFIQRRAALPHEPDLNFDL